MSYQITITRNNIPDTDKEAWKTLEDLKDDDGEAGADDFIALLREFLKRFPCLTTFPDDKLHDSVWADGPLLNNAGNRLTTLRLKSDKAKAALPVLIEIANNRNFVIFDSQTKSIFRPEGNVFIEFENSDRHIEKLISDLPCPVCGESHKQIDISKKGQVISFVFLSGLDKILISGCKDCLRKKIKNSMTLSLILGWWAIPFGPINTVRAIRFNRQRIKETYNEERTSDFYRFIHQNRDFILENKNNSEELFDLISGINKPLGTL